MKKTSGGDTDRGGEDLDRGRMLRGGGRKEGVWEIDSSRLVMIAGWWG